MYILVQLSKWLPATFSAFGVPLPVPLRPLSVLHHFRFISCAIFLYLCSRVFAPCTHIRDGLSLASLFRPLLVFPLGFSSQFYRLSPPPSFCGCSCSVYVYSFSSVQFSSVQFRIACTVLFPHFPFPFSLAACNCFCQSVYCK